MNGGCSLLGCGRLTQSAKERCFDRLCNAIRDEQGKNKRRHGYVRRDEGKEQCNQMHTEIGKPESLESLLAEFHPYGFESTEVPVSPETQDEPASDRSQIRRIPRVEGWNRAPFQERRPEHRSVRARQLYVHHPVVEVAEPKPFHHPNGHDAQRRHEHIGGNQGSAVEEVFDASAYRKPLELHVSEQRSANSPKTTIALKGIQLIH